ncbi:MAG: class I SAM-dependent methyltransferase [Chloroflexota bacterium]
MLSEGQFPTGYFNRMDNSADENFYQMPRLVVHIDDHAIQTLSQTFARILPVTGSYLDLMSSWRTHLPDTLHPDRVVGLGMNEAEMQDNPQLDDVIVHNLNQDPTLPFDDATFDAVTCTVSVQYMVKPLTIFREVNRVLKPGGIFAVSFSNRCFQQKAVAVWLSTTDEQHVQLVNQYFTDGGNWTGLQTERTPSKMRLSGFTDPLYVIWASKQP